MSFAGLDAWLRSRAEADLFSGVVLIRRGEATLFAGAYGWASRRWAAPVTLATRFDTASITKLFTAVAALQLVDQGRLDLDTSILDLVELTGSTISPAVTVRQLLTHTSGIADDADEEAGEDFEALWGDKPCYSVIETPRLAASVRRQASSVSAGYGMPILQRRIHPGRPGNRGDNRHRLPRPYPQRRVRPRRNDRVGLLRPARGGAGRGGGLGSGARRGRDAERVEAEHLQLSTDRVSGQRSPGHRGRSGRLRAGGARGSTALGRAHRAVPHPAGVASPDQLDVVVLSNSADGAWPPIAEIHRLIRADDPSIGESGIGFG